MNDAQTPNETSDPIGDASALTGPDHAAAKEQVERILTLDEILSSATRAERTQPICTNGKLKAEYDAIISELGELVDAEGNVLDESGGEASMAEEAHAARLQAQASKLLREIRMATVSFRFRAMPSDEWDEFDESHRTGSDKRLKNQRKYEDELIAACAVSPVLDVAGVAKLRKTFGSAQVTALFNAAFYANKADGLDVPKSPSFLHAPKPQE